jgi:DUF2971 family protein
MLDSTNDQPSGEAAHMVDPISDLLSTPIPERLWHYTSIQGFQGITTSKKIFATDLRFLNDREEFVHAQKLASEVVQEVPETTSNGLPAKEYSQKAVDLAFSTGPLQPSRLQIFVACFSAAEDQLSQWRGYSRGSSGVSLAFDLKALRPPADIGTLVSFAPCVYEVALKKKLIQHALHHFTDEVSAFWNGAVEAARGLVTSGATAESVREIAERLRNPTNVSDFTKRLIDATHKTQVDLLRIAALLKNSSFHEEIEWRLVLPVSTAKESLQNPILFRPGSTTLIPYIAYPFSRNPDSPLPLTDVILGPSSDANFVSAAQAFLRSEGIRLIPRQSEVPYRPW